MAAANAQQGAKPRAAEADPRGGIARARLCVGCRQHDEREELLRLVLAGDPPRIVPDVARGARGRGVSVHATRKCLQLAVRSGALGRGLRAPLQVDAAELAAWAAGQYERRLAGLLGAAHRTGAASIGSERVRDAIAQRKVELLLLANDAGEGQQDLQRSLERLGGRCAVYGDKASLGRLFARELVAVVAITDAALADAVRSALRCLSELGAGGTGRVVSSDSNASSCGGAQHEISG